MDPPTPRPKSEPAQARELAGAFARHGVEYLFPGKAGAILPGNPGKTMDVDLFAPKDPENARRCIRALEQIGFPLDDSTRAALLAGMDFVQIKDGPFDVDIVHAANGIESFADARRRRVLEDN